MSQENVEQQYRAADAFSRHDIDAFLAICDPDIELVSRHLELDGSGHLRGHAAVRRWWETLLSVYPDFTSEIEEVRDLGDVTIARHHFRGEGMESGAQLEQRHWQVTRWRHNKAVWWRSCPTEAEAFEAVGLEVVRKQFGDTNARDFAAVMDAYAEDVELVMHGEKVGMLGRTVSGKDAVGEWFGDWLRQFDRDYRFDIEESRGIGDRVLLVATHHGRGRDSGVPVRERWAYVYTVREGKVSHVELWGDHDAREAALEAVGLRE